MAESPFEPGRANDSQQDTNYVPNEIEDTLKGASAAPGSAVWSAIAGSAATNNAVGFVGQRRVPDEDEK